MSEEESPKEAVKEESPEEKEKRVEELKKKYGVMEEIPKQKIEGEPKEEKKIEESIEEPEAKVSLTDLLMKIEKIEGKFDVISQFKTDTDEKITQLAEEIGELRSSIIEKDQSFSKIETEFEKMKDSIGDIEPLKIRKGFEKRDQEIEEGKAKIEKLENLIKALSGETKNFRETMEKIKSFENLVKISEKIDKKISRIEDTKQYADKTASKVESIFGEMSEKLSELESQTSKITKLDELTVEMAKMLDEVSTKLNKFAESKDLKEFKKAVEEDLKQLKMSIQTKTEKGEVKYIPGVGEEFSKLSENFSELSSRMTALRSIVEKQNSMINNVISSLEARKTEPAIDKESLEGIELITRFFELSNLLLHTTDQVSLKDYSEQMKETVQKMKEQGIWTDEKEKFMKDILETTRKITEIKGQGEAISKIHELAEWMNNILEEINQMKQSKREMDRDIENVKKYVRKKADIKDIQGVLVLERELSQLSSKISKMKSIIERQNLIIDDVVENLHQKQPSKIDAEKIKEIELDNRFYQLLNMLPYEKDPVKLRNYSVGLQEIVEEMKLDNIWTDEKEKFMKNILETSKNVIKAQHKKDKLLEDLSLKLEEFDKKKMMKFEREIKDDLEKIKESMKNKLDAREIENIYKQEKMISELLSKLSRLKEIVERQNDVITNLVESAKERKALGIDVESMRKVQLSVKFYQILNMLPYILEPGRIRKYLSELKELIDEMKSKEMWDDEKERFMKNLLSSLADTFQSRGYEEIGSAYAKGI